MLHHIEDVDFRVDPIIIDDVFYVQLENGALLTSLLNFFVLQLTNFFGDTSMRAARPCMQRNKWEGLV